MSEQEALLHEKIAEMEGDFRTISKAFINLLGSFGLTPEDLSGGQMSIMTKLPGMLNKLSVQLMTGSFDQSTFDQVSSLQPLLEKYKTLLDDVQE